MTLAQVTPAGAEGRWLWRWLALVLIVGTAGLRLWYVASACPLDLAPDEAHYWDWSRHLDCSYYSKGPAVAYLIRAGTWLTGGWSIGHTASLMPAVRLPAIICGSLLLTALYILAVQVNGSDRLAFFGIAAVAILPVMSAGSLLMTIDAPYCCCWAWALVLGHRAIFRNSKWAWVAVGMVVGLGILAKYTMLLWVVSVLLFLLTSRTLRSRLVGSGFWLMLVMASLCCLPIVAWNVQHNWAGLRHVEGLTGAGQAHGILWTGPLVYLGSQFGLLMGFWFVIWLAAMIRHAPWRESELGTCYLWWMSAVMFTVFLAFSLRTQEQPNWPVTAYLSGQVLACPWLVRQVKSPRGWYRRFMIGATALASALSLGLTLLVHHSDWIQSELLALSEMCGHPRELPLRRIDPTCRLRGWQMLGREVDRAKRALQGEGCDPLIAATWWTYPGELGFYCEGAPTVYSLGLAMGDRHSQYDFWRPNPILDEKEFLGRTMIVVGEPGPPLLGAFVRVEPARVVTYAEHGQPIAQWKLMICHGFRGFSNTETHSVTRY
jgi:hypothetical protein